MGPTPEKNPPLDPRVGVFPSQKPNKYVHLAVPTCMMTQPLWQPPPPPLVLRLCSTLPNATTFLFMRNKGMHVGWHCCEGCRSHGVIRGVRGPTGNR